jgi:hypothetical protein
MALIIGADAHSRIGGAQPALETTSGEIEQNARAGAVGGAGGMGRRLPTRRRFSPQLLASIALQILRAMKSWRAKRRAAHMRRLRSRR